MEPHSATVIKIFRCRMVIQMLLCKIVWFTSAQSGHLVQADPVPGPRLPLVERCGDQKENTRLKERHPIHGASRNLVHGRTSKR